MFPGPGTRRSFSVRLPLSPNVTIIWFSVALGSGGGGMAAITEIVVPEESGWPRASATVNVNVWLPPFGMLNVVGLAEGPRGNVMVPVAGGAEAVHRGGVGPERAGVPANQVR